MLLLSDCEPPDCEEEDDDDNGSEASREDSDVRLDNASEEEVIGMDESVAKTEEMVDGELVSSSASSNAGGRSACSAMGPD